MSGRCRHERAVLSLSSKTGVGCQRPCSRTARVRPLGLRSAKQIGDASLAQLRRRCPVEQGSRFVGQEGRAFVYRDHLSLQGDFAFECSQLLFLGLGPPLHSSSVALIPAQRARREDNVMNEPALAGTAMGGHGRCPAR